MTKAQARNAAKSRRGVPLACGGGIGGRQWHGEAILDRSNADCAAVSIAEEGAFAPLLLG
jgi:hypothetical protein